MMGTEISKIELLEPELFGTFLGRLAFPRDSISSILVPLHAVR